MKKKIIYFAVIGGFLAIASCSKKFLTRSPYNALPLGTAITSESDLLVANTGMYSGLRNTDLYGRTLPVKGDLMADNSFVTTSNSNRYISLNNFVFANNDQYALAIWANAYAAIKYANTIINTTLAQSDANIKQYIGEAYAVRALMEFELVRNYAHPVTLAPTDPGVPYVTTFSQSALPARGTVKDDYTQIIADLEKAYGLLSIYRGTAYFSKYSARALEARVYSEYGRLAKCRSNGAGCDPKRRLGHAGPYGICQSQRNIGYRPHQSDEYLFAGRILGKPERTGIQQK